MLCHINFDGLGYWGNIVNKENIDNFSNSMTIMATLFENVDAKCQYSEIHNEVKQAYKKGYCSWGDFIFNKLAISD